MNQIKFKRDYGYPPASPAFFCWHDGQCSQMFETRVEADRAASAIAITRPGQDVLVLAAVAALRTSGEIVGERFNPDRVAHDPVIEPAPVPEFPEAADPDVPLASQEPL